MLSFAALRRHVASSDPASTPGSPAWSKMPMVTSSSPLDPRPSSRPSSRRLRRRPLTTASQRATHPCSPIYITCNRLVNRPCSPIFRFSLPFIPATHPCNPMLSHSCKRISVAMTLPQPKARSPAPLLRALHPPRPPPFFILTASILHPPPRPPPSFILTASILHPHCLHSSSSSAPASILHPHPSPLPRARLHSLSSSTPLPPTPPFSPLSHTCHLSTLTLPISGHPRHGRLPRPYLPPDLPPPSLPSSFIAAAQPAAAVA